MPTDTGATRALYRLKVRGLGRETAVELWDDATGAVAATSTFTGKAAFATMTIDCEPSGRSWLATPNRKALPTSWRLEPDGGSLATVFSRPVGAQLLNPLARELLSFSRAGGGEKYRVLDARHNQFGRLLNLERSAWVLARDEDMVATLGFARDPRSAEPPSTTNSGPLGRLRGATVLRGAKVLRGVPDRALRSTGDTHALAAAETLFLLALVAELTEG